MSVKLFVVVLRYLFDLETINRSREDHVKFLDKYYSNGKIILSGRQNPSNGGLILIYAENRDEVLQIMQEDPFVNRKLVEITVFEFNPVRFDKLREFAEQFYGINNSIKAEITNK